MTEIVLRHSFNTGASNCNSQGCELDTGGYSSKNISCRWRQLDGSSGGFQQPCWRTLAFRSEWQIAGCRMTQRQGVFTQNTCHWLWPNTCSNLRGPFMGFQSRTDTRVELPTPQSAVQRNVAQHVARPHFPVSSTRFHSRRN